MGAHLLLLLVVLEDLLDLGDVFFEAEALERGDDVLGRDRLFGLALADLVRVGRDEVDELCADSALGRAYMCTTHRRNIR